MKVRIVALVQIYLICSSILCFAQEETTHVKISEQVPPI